MEALKFINQINQKNSIVHIEVAENIYKLLNEGSLFRICRIMENLKSKDEKRYVINAFKKKYDFNFLNYIQFYFTKIKQKGQERQDQGVFLGEQDILTFQFTIGFVLFLCLSKEKERKRKDTKIKDQNTHIPHKPTLHKMFCKRKFERIRLFVRTF